MSLIASHPNPCLVAILLVCNTRHGSGAQILFHYPPNPLSDRSNSSTTESAVDDSDDDSSSVSDESLTDEDDLLGETFVNSRSTGHHAAPSFDGIKSSGNINSTGSNESRQTGDSLFGLGEDGLVSLLSPDRIWHKRRFELSINDLTFVGRPVFVRNDGLWTKKKRSKIRGRKLEGVTSDTASASEDTQETELNTQSTTTVDDDDSAQPDKSPLTMFHVVFVMNPPPLEHVSRVKDMYDHVIKKFSRALKWEQVHNDYIRKQAEIILSVRSSSSAKRLSRAQLCAEILDKSSLAAAIATVYAAIDNSRIASVTLSPKVSVSLQIPPITFTAYLPSLTEAPIQPGLWLTTATDLGSVVGDTDGVSTPSSSQLAKHYTLLLKVHPQRIVRDAIDAGGPLAQHLPKLVAALRPTKSFYKLSASLQISPADIQLLARHLIYWRRAIAIPPLHRRDTYIVSPNADLRKLREASRSYDQQFPQAVPSLPKMLSNLSGVPQPYGVHIPSSDHKQTYLLVLAWLMRNGWVTQLRTFAYISVDPSTKRAVRELGRESRIRMSTQQTPQDNEPDVKEPTRSLKKRPSLVSQGSSEGRSSLEASRLAQDSKATSLILNPPRATAIESRWLDYIGESLSSSEAARKRLSPEDRAQIQKYWPTLVKYFDGHVALETIPIRENEKRKFIWDLLGKMGIKFDGGVENEDVETRNRVVILRHW